VVVSALTGLLPRALARGFGIVGRIAGENVVRAPMRSGVTVAAIGLVTAIAVTLASVTSSYLATAAEYIAGLHDGDLAVSAVADRGRMARDADRAHDRRRARRIPAFGGSKPARVVPGESFRGGRIGLLALEPEALMRLGAACGVPATTSRTRGGRRGLGGCRLDDLQPSPRHWGRRPHRARDTAWPPRPAHHRARSPT